MGARSLTEVLTDLNICTAAFKEDVVRVVTQDTFISSRLLKKSRAVSGGKYISQPLDYGSGNARAMGEYDEITLSPEETMDEAQFNWKWINDTVVLSEKKIDIQNVGKEQLINLTEHKYKTLARTFKEKFEELLFATTIGTNAPESLYSICTTQNNTVGGIDAATGIGGSGTIVLPFDWNPKILDVSASGTVTVTFDDLINPASKYYIENIMQVIYGALAVGNDTPTIAVTTQVVWDAYEKVLRADKRFDSAYNQSADAGFDTLKFRNMLIAVDENVPGGSLNTDSTTYSYMYVLNENYLHFRHKKGKDFTATKWKKAEKQHVYFSEMNWWGGFTTSRRDKQGSVYGLPTTRNSLSVT